MSTPFGMLTIKNAVLYASSIYDNPGCVSIDEFMEDYKRFKYVKRLCRRYVSTKEIAERLYRILKPFLLYLDILPDVVRGIDGFDIVTETIPSDARITRRLREL